MPDWQSPAELQLEGGIFAKFMHALLGLYAYVVFFFTRFSWFPVSNTANLRYEFVLTLDFDWAFISGKKRFRWPLVKYSFLTAFLPAFNLSVDLLFCQSIFFIGSPYWNVSL